MVYLFKLIVLCAMCEFCFATMKIFNWYEFKSIPGNTVNFDIHLETVQNANGKPIQYPSGTLTFNKPMDNFVKIHYELYTRNGKKIEKIDKMNSVCDHTFYQNYLLPFTANSDYKSSDKCPVEPNNFIFKKVKTVDELKQNSNLPGGLYIIKITYVNKDRIVVGGYYGAFDCLPA